MNDVSGLQKAVATIITVLFTFWIAWVSWSVTHNSGGLATEIERSKIKDERMEGWLRHTSSVANSNKDRIITLEVMQGVHHRSGHTTPPTTRHERTD